jgi:predicted ATPase/DNA-binding SARP family transcriptional activator
MEFRILGSFEVDGTAGVLEVRGAKRRRLLACLVVNAGQPMSVNRLVDELWEDGGSRGAARTVQTYVSQLRKLLRSETARLETRPGGYVLDIDPVDVDASRFEQEVIAASAEGDPAHQLAALDAALRLWRGPPLREFAGAGWADREASRLEALRLQALHRRFDALLALDRPAESVGDLEALVRDHPLDERFGEQLMVALYRSGRQADALSAYQQARRHLIDQLGIEPGPRLVDLERQILDHDPTLIAPTSQAAGNEQPGAASVTADGWYPRTFLLTEVVDSVSLWERDPRAMAQALARHDTIVEDAVNSSGGELVRTKGEGDSTLSAFAHPADALQAAVTVHMAFAGQLWPSATGEIRVRAGVHTGDAERRYHDWYGPAVNRASRLRAMAKPARTLVSGVTAGLVADQLPKDARLLYRGRRVLRGIDRPEQVWELVAADDPELAASAPSVTGGLPVSLTRFIGRVADLDHLSQLLETERLITLTGLGGAGKTRLAMETARYAAARGETVWLVQLAPLHDEGLVAQTVAAAVGVETGPDAVHDLLARAEPLAGLLVLDNCEHLLESCATLIEGLLRAAPELRVLATSRESLGLGGERVWPVKPLDVPNESPPSRELLIQVESVQLLLDRARAVRPDLRLDDDDMASIASICRALEGVPLAIELAASRLRSLNFTDLAGRLNDQVALLARHRPTGRDEARHRTLRMTFDWSYDLLTYHQQILAQRLSVFAGGFRLDAVEAVGDDLDPLDGVDELVAKSMVTFDGTTARYRLLEPLRQYLAERLEESAVTETVLRAHAEWVAGLCDRLGPRVHEGQRRHSHRLREEADNIDLALRWAYSHDQDLAIRIVGPLGQYWFFYDQPRGRRWCQTVIDAGPGTSPLRWAYALVSAAMVAQNDQSWDRSIAWVREALGIYRDQGVVVGQAASLYWLGRALRFRWDPEHNQHDAREATRCFEESLRLYLQAGRWAGAGWCRIWLSHQAHWDGDLDRAEHLARQVLEDCRATGVRHPMGEALSTLAYVARRRGHNDAALDLLQEAVALHRDSDVPWLLAGSLAELAMQKATMGQGAEALQSLAESTRIADRVGPMPGRSIRLAAAACIHLARGQSTLSASALGAYDAHPPGNPAWPRNRAGKYVGWLGDAVESTRAQLNPVEVARATARARRRSLDQLMDELIIQPARATEVAKPRP